MGVCGIYCCVETVGNGVVWVDDVVDVFDCKTAVCVLSTANEGCVGGFVGARFLVVEAGLERCSFKKEEEACWRAA